MESPTQCPMCGLKSTEFRVETNYVFGNPLGHNGRAFFECSNCTIFFQWPLLNAEQERDFYQLEFEKFMATRSPAGDIDWTKPYRHRQTNEAQRRRRENYLHSHYQSLSMLEGAALLEVGCSSGFMLSGLKERYGIECYGVEPSNVFRELLDSEGYRIYSSLSELRSRHQHLRFSLITHFFVLEHIRDPAPFLIEQMELLLPGGSIIFEVPNAADPLRTVFPTDAFEKFYWSIAHPWYFTEESMQYLLREKCGFSSFKVNLDQRYDIGNHAQWMLRGQPGGQGSLRDVFDSQFEEQYRLALIRSRKTDTLVVEIRKEANS
jgi:2-polyprenyl-3-methyl-5-hydroxy-6-metoxy-1,4-benzoquinol methylase